MRDPAQLIEHQRLMHEQYLAACGLAAPASSGLVHGTTTVPMTWGGLHWARVTKIVTEDTDKGPHLLAQPRAYIGSPPVLTDLPLDVILCVAAPTRGVEAYEVGEEIQLVPSGGVVVAVPIPG